MSLVVVTFYHFFDFSQAAECRLPLLAELKRLSITGTILVAPEGINGTVAGSRENIDALLAHIRAEITRAPLTHKESRCAVPPFRRAKVRLKKETISLGEQVLMHPAGEYVDAKRWNALLNDPDTIVVDARNAYEIHLGTFEGARNPQVRNFKELPAYARNELGGFKQRKIATFCTGGIRCEKFTAWLRAEGFEQVFHLEGGILKYLEEIAPGESKWQGECYVFDARVAVGHGLQPSNSATQCDACGRALTPQDRAHPFYSAGSSCPFCDGNVSCKKSRPAEMGNSQL